MTTVQEALAAGPSASARERTVDITTTGARTGRPRRIEIWFHRFDDRIFLTGTPAPRAWAANLVADPRLVFHLKHGVVADLPATARRIDDAAERRRVLRGIIDGLNRPGGRTRVADDQVEAWMSGSPLFEVVFDDPQLV